MKYLLWWLIGLTPGFVRAQETAFFRHFTEKDGLSSNQVTCLLRDREGYLWVGTNYGLNRFDGRRFRQYLPHAQESGFTVCHEYITALAQDDAGIIWIGTRNGLNRYDPRTRRFQTLQNTGRNDGSLPNNLIHDLKPDGKDLWVACDNRDLARLNTQTGAFTLFPWKKFTDTALPASAEKTYKNIQQLRKKSDHSWWLYTNLGLMSFDIQNGNFEVFPLQNTTRGTWQSFNTCDASTSWGQAGRLFFLNACTRQWWEMAAAFPTATAAEEIAPVQQVRAGQWHWVLTGQGLYRWNTGEAVPHPQALVPDRRNQAPEGAMHTLLADQAGMIWFGGENGLWLLDPALQHFHWIALQNDRSAPTRFHRVLEIPDTPFRLVTDLDQGRLLVLNRHKLVHTLALGGPAGILHLDQLGRIWVSGGMQLYQLDPQGWHLKPVPLPQLPTRKDKNAGFTDFEIDAAGDYWLTSDDSGLWRYRVSEQRWEKPGPEQGFISGFPTCVYADPMGNSVWIGTDDYGLFRYDRASGKYRLYRHETNQPGSLGAYMVHDAGFYQNGYLWIATDPGGVARFDYNAPEGQEFINITTNERLPSNQVYSLTQDKPGNLWAGTTKGLACIRQADLQVAAWTKNDGLHQENLSLPFSTGASGAVYMGGLRGFEYFYPDSLLVAPFDGRILLNSFKVFDREISGTFDSVVPLQWRDNFISIECASAQFSQPQRVRFWAQLEGFDPYPVSLDADNRRSWTNIPPGHYTLMLMARRDDLQTAFYKIAVQISPPFWQTWWFRLLAWGMLAGIIAWAFHRRITRIKREALLKNEFDRQLARVEMAALRAQMNPHFVFNCLNSINRYILVNNPDEASAYLTKFSRLIRRILDNSRSETVSLDKELEALRLYIELEIMRFDGHFDYEIQMDASIQPEHVEIPPLLLQPYVENAIWHGLMHKKTRGYLRVRVTGNQEVLQIVIEDNGIGRAQAQALRSKSAQNHKSHGMHLGAERLELLHRWYGKTTSVDIEDLFHPDGSAAGTRVTIRIC